ncbi:hypothetical protein HMPREF1991_02993 [Hoylesella loescheii DSM 19665 = JCM 12249 = ATCC 15930]|uniref:Uncharacterized protein n=1 Tax=Hoylesella loescheii DSM 19665 = JCM 12249 = ATCC 15930 TaxID=1122985 RepID=A0A069QFZ9_HOYLO|nr:hypothetical protein HMPREF1991_02993 [Hoylesella loescheii DSM 19665 = JCM 12249 = ATCC 15930]
MALAIFSPFHLFTLSPLRSKARCLPRYVTYCCQYSSNNIITRQFTAILP